MSEISETEIKAMTKEQNYIRGYKDGKSDVLDKIKQTREEIQKLVDMCGSDTVADLNMKSGLGLALEKIDRNITYVFSVRQESEDKE